MLPDNGAMLPKGKSFIKMLKFAFLRDFVSSWQNITLISHHEKTEA